MIERCGDGGEDQGADEAFMGVCAKREPLRPFCEAVISRASGSPFTCEEVSREDT